MPWFKRLCFVRKAPGAEGSSFGRRWRAEALRRLESIPPALRPLRLAHCVARTGRDAPRYDGMSIGWFADQAKLAGHDQLDAEQDEPGARSVIDRPSSVSRLVEERCVFGTHELEALWQLPAGAQRLLLIGLVRKASGLSRREFAEYWWHQHRPLANRLFPPELQPPVYLHNYVLGDQPCAWDGVGELYESSLDIARRRGQWMGSAAAAPILDDEFRFMEPAARAVLVTDYEVLIPACQGAHWA
jgi:hypothetical protein